MKCLRTETHCGFCDATLLYRGRSFPVYSDLQIEATRKRNAKSRIQNRNRIVELRGLTTSFEGRVHPDGLLCMTHYRTGKVCHNKPHQYVTIRGTS